MKLLIVVGILCCVLFGGENADAGKPVSLLNKLTGKSKATQNQLDFGQALEMFLSAYSKIMPCGDPEANLPILAPYRIDQVPINISNANLNVQGSLSNFLVTGLNKGNIIQLAYNSSNNRTTFDVIFTQMQTLAEVDVSVWALLAGYPLQTAWKGLFNEKYEDFRVYGYFTFGQSLSNPNGLRMTDLQMNYLMGNVQSDNWNNLYNIAANNYINRFMSDFILMYSEQIQNHLQSIYQTEVLPYVNNALENVSLSTLIEILEATANLWNSVDCTIV